MLLIRALILSFSLLSVASGLYWAEFQSLHFFIRFTDFLHTSLYSSCDAPLLLSSSLIFLLPFTPHSSSSLISCFGSLHFLSFIFYILLVSPSHSDCFWNSHLIILPHSLALPSNSSLPLTIGLCPSHLITIPHSLSLPSPSSLSLTDCLSLVPLMSLLSLTHFLLLHLPHPSFSLVSSVSSHSLIPTFIHSIILLHLHFFLAFIHPFI